MGRGGENLRMTLLLHAHYHLHRRGTGLLFVVGISIALSNESILHRSDNGAIKTSLHNMEKPDKKTSPNPKKKKKSGKQEIYLRNRGN